MTADKVSREELQDRRSEQRRRAYDSKALQVETQINTLRRLLAQHKAKSDASDNWGFNGDIGYVQERLAEALQHLGA